MTRLELISSALMNEQSRYNVTGDMLGRLNGALRDKAPKDLPSQVAYAIIYSALHSLGAPESTIMVVCYDAERPVAMLSSGWNATLLVADGTYVSWSHENQKWLNMNTLENIGKLPQTPEESLLIHLAPRYERVLKKVEDAERKQNNESNP